MKKLFCSESCREAMRRRLRQGEKMPDGIWQGKRVTWATLCRNQGICPTCLERADGMRDIVTIELPDIGEKSR